ncbi:zinc finger BED domain-containing protein 4-like isoform 2-T2 [Acanthopagrus schlegelii]
MPKSKAWLYFRKTDSNNARCSICDKTIACKSGNTSNMLKHLTVHGINLRAESCTVFSHTPPSASSTTTPATATAPTTSLQDVLRPDSDSSESTEHSAVSDISSGLPEHAVILDVKNRWNSLFLMVERFLEQFPALQAASMDPRLKRSMEKDRLERVTDDDYRKAEEFVRVMKILYTSTLCISAERSPTLGQILPILGKLQHHFTVTDGDSSFTQAIKEKIWGDLAQRYQDEGIRQFLEEGTALDPRFKTKVTDEVWTRLEKELINRTSQQNKGVATQVQQMEQDLEGTAGSHGEDSSGEDSTVAVATKKKAGLPALGELFEDEDMAVESQQEMPHTITEKAQEEIQRYRGLPSTLTSVNPATWWWTVRDTLPLLSDLATKYLCVQASSTPAERTFSTAGDTISQERACLSPEKADMLIFLKKNC